MITCGSGDAALLSASCAPRFEIVCFMAATLCGCSMFSTTVRVMHRVSRPHRTSPNQGGARRTIRLERFAHLGKAHVVANGGRHHRHRRVEAVAAGRRIGPRRAVRCSVLTERVRHGVESAVVTSGSEDRQTDRQGDGARAACHSERCLWCYKPISVLYFYCMCHHWN